jgi:alginate O-acetyltransferase complex protein AlgI
MLFNDFKFFGFFAIVYLLFFAMPKKGKNIILLLSSYVFYSFWDWRFLLLLMLSTLIDYFFGLIIYNTEGNGKKKMYMWFGIFNNLLVLGFFKYYNFFIDSFGALLIHFGFEAHFPILNIILPVGISFYTFHGMSYVIDIYRNQCIPTRNIINYSLFVSYFPLLVAGPIERATHLLPQIENKNRIITRQHLLDGLSLILIGYLKKVLISDNIGYKADYVFNNIATCSSFELITGLIIFSFQIYFDFSGYSDIGRGISKLFGIDLLINFNQPYLSQNISEFWKRWHISLSSWLRDYLYISLGGNKNGKAKTYINLFITMLLGGLWHGASWNFVIWGGLHGSYLTIHKILGGSNKTYPFSFNSFKLGFKSFFNILFTYILVLLTWLPFRSKSLEDTMNFIVKFVHFDGGVEAIDVITIFSLFIVLLILDLPAYLANSHTSFIYKLPKWLIALLILISSIAIITSMAINQNNIRPFIYFQF